VAGGRAALHSVERLLHVPHPATSSPLPQPTAAPDNGECSGDNGGAVDEKAAGDAAGRDGRGGEVGGDTAAACSAVGCSGGVRRPPVGDGSEAATGGEG
jgi:hypothetical protein